MRTDLHFGGESSGAGRNAPAEPFEERHFPVAHWARLWGFSEKTIREWFRDDFGAGHP
jgi:hypothetical protein